MEFPAYSAIEASEIPPMEQMLNVSLSRPWPGGQFVPTNNLKLNQLVKALGVKVYVDIPNIESNVPYTDTAKGEIHLPSPEAFMTPDLYAHVVAHEIAHYIGWKLMRPGVMPYPAYLRWVTDRYEKEELTAELTAMGIEQATLGYVPDMHLRLGYLRSWLKGTPKEHASRESLYDAAQLDAEFAVAYALRYLED